MSTGLAALIIGSVVGVAGALIARDSLLRGTRFVVLLCISIAMPLVGCLAFAKAGYASWDWAPFAYGSYAPIAISACGQGAAVFTLFFRRGVSIMGALAIALASAISFIPISLFGLLFVACSMGDCL